MTSGQATYENHSQARDPGRVSTCALTCLRHDPFGALALAVGQPACQGSIRSTPVSEKCLVFRVATANRREAAIAAM